MRECGLSRKLAEARRCSRQGSRDPFLHVPTGGAGAQDESPENDERADEFVCLKQRAGTQDRGCVVLWASGFLVEGDAAKRDRLGRAGLAWRRNDDAQPECARGTPAGIGGFVWRYRYGSCGRPIWETSGRPFLAVARIGGLSEGVNHEAEVYGEVPAV